MAISQICDEDSFECGTGITLIILFILAFFVNVLFFVKSLIAQKTITYELFAVFAACADVKLNSKTNKSHIYLSAYAWLYMSRL